MSDSAKAGFSAPLVLLMAVSCGLIVANLYYAQPLLHLISIDLKIDEAAAGALVTMAQTGYGLGLLFIVPLGDLFENRRLIITITSLGILALFWAGFTGTASHFFAAMLLIGIGSVAVQVIVPYAAHIAPQEIQGRVVGYVVSGLMVGIMFARPVSSFMTELTSWHMIFRVSAAALIILMFVLYKKMPVRRPEAKIGYRELMLSMVSLLKTTRVLQRRAAYQACMFGAFSLFWTTAPLFLSGPYYGMSQGKIALFGLAGAAGAIAAPIAGRSADKGISRAMSGGAMLLGIFAFAVTFIAEPGSLTAVVFLVIAAVALDCGVTANLIFSQRAVYALGAEHRGRLNGLFMAIFFAGGAVGSALGGYVYAHFGWHGAALAGICLPVISLLYLLTEPKGLYK